ncbi:cilia- and flagella-associated protein 276 [Emydura macquarii macquarii]|uniref:cilia- and flagella-associated protein 276 n=1 Tax=Emydura macquarii macquarii TaxID=1129001 RepID=UPI00352BCD96
MPPTRDPFPYPRYENEDTFSGRARLAQTGPYTEPTHLAQQRDPWNRLHKTPTLSSTRKEVWYSEPEVPRDSLDFKMTSVYNHHEELLRDKNQIVIHKETLFDDHGMLKGLEPVKEPEPPPVECHTARGLSVRRWVSPMKESIHSIEGAIECPHTAATNSGYSRKENGSFFSR